VVQGLSSDVIGRIAADRGIALRELTPRQATLEEVFMQITQDSVEYGHHEGVTQ
jgi:ABC-2 type transport system ATP-binding protein